MKLDAYWTDSAPAFRPQPRVNPRKRSGRTRLRQGGKQSFGGTAFRPDKKNVEIGAVSNFATTEFSKRDNRERLVGVHHPLCENQAGFRQIILLREKLR